VTKGVGGRCNWCTVVSNGTDAACVLLNTEVQKHCDIIASNKAKYDLLRFMKINGC
jgi:hypothetical protein